MKRRRFFETLTAGLLAILVIAGGSALAAPPEGKGGGKGGGGGDDGGTTDPLPPVRYALQRFAMPADYAGGTVGVRAMNDFNEVAGYYPPSAGGEQPFYYNALSGGSSPINLNDLQLAEGYTVPEGWYIYIATDINNWGDICGALALASDPQQLRGFVLELRPDPVDPNLLPRLHLLPDEAWSRTYASRINDVGEVLGRGDASTSYIYRPALHGAAADAAVQVLPFAFDAWYASFNNPFDGRRAQVVTHTGTLYRYTLGDAAAEILDVDVGSVRGLNDLGTFCGHYYKGKYYGYWYDGTRHLISGMKFAQDINNSGDIVGSNNVLYHPTYGLLDLDTLVVAADDTELQIWTDGVPAGYALTERDPAAADFPGLAGVLRRYDTEYSFFYDAYVLLPVPAP